MNLYQNIIYTLPTYNGYYFICHAAFYFTFYSFWSFIFHLFLLVCLLWKKIVFYTLKNLIIWK